MWMLRSYRFLVLSDLTVISQHSPSILLKVSIKLLSPKICCFNLAQLSILFALFVSSSVYPQQSVLFFYFKNKFSKNSKQIKNISIVHTYRKDFIDDITSVSESVKFQKKTKIKFKAIAKKPTYYLKL